MAAKLLVENRSEFIIIHIFLFFIIFVFNTFVFNNVFKAQIRLLTTLHSNGWLSLRIWLNVMMLMNL